MDLNGNYAKFIPSHSISPHQLLHGPSSWFSQRHAAHHEAPRHVVRRGAGGREGTAEVATQAGPGGSLGWKYGEDPGKSCENAGRSWENPGKMRENDGNILGKCGKIMGKSWENAGKSWENLGKMQEKGLENWNKREDIIGKWWQNLGKWIIS